MYYNLKTKCCGSELCLSNSGEQRTICRKCGKEVIISDCIACIPPTETKNWNNEPCGNKECEICNPNESWEAELKDLWFRSNGQTPHFLEVLKPFIASQKELSYNEGYAKAVRLHEEKEKKAFEEGYKVGHDKCSEDEGN